MEKATSQLGFQARPSHLPGLRTASWKSHVGQGQGPHRRTRHGVIGRAGGQRWKGRPHVCTKGKQVRARTFLTETRKLHPKRYTSGCPTTPHSLLASYSLLLGSFPLSSAPVPNTQPCLLPHSRPKVKNILLTQASCGWRPCSQGLSPAKPARPPAPHPSRHSLGFSWPSPLGPRSAQL